MTKGVARNPFPLMPFYETLLVGDAICVDGHQNNREKAQGTMQKTGQIKSGSFGSHSLSNTACAAASRAMGTRGAEQET